MLGGAEAGACALGDGFQEAGDSVSLAPSERPETKPEAWPAARDPQEAEEKVPASAAEAVPEAHLLAGGPWEESISLPLEAPLPEGRKAVASALCGGPPPQVSKEHIIGLHHQRGLLCELCLGCAGWVQRAAPSCGTPLPMVPSCPPEAFALCDICHGGAAWCSPFPSAQGPGLTSPPTPALRSALGPGCRARREGVTPAAAPSHTQRASPLLPPTWPPLFPPARHSPQPSPAAMAPPQALSHLCATRRSLPLGLTALGSIPQPQTLPHIHPGAPVS